MDKHDINTWYTNMNNFINEYVQSACNNEPHLFDVLDIQLTPYGRHLLQNGSLMPQYYAFFDDDVIYDSSAGGFTEKNSDTKNRILNETPILKPHYLFKNLEDTVNKDQPFPTSQYNKIKRPGADDCTKFLQYSMGTSDPTKQKAPSWEIFALQNEHFPF